MVDCEGMHASVFVSHDHTEIGDMSALEEDRTSQCRRYHAARYLYGTHMSQKFQGRTHPVLAVLRMDGFWLELADVDHDHCWRSHPVLAETFSPSLVQEVQLHPRGRVGRGLLSYDFHSLFRGVWRFRQVETVPNLGR